MTKLPVVDAGALSRCCVFSATACHSYAEILYKAAKLAQTLPDEPYCILLCEQRDKFIIAYLAALMRKQTLLLPPSKVAVVLQELQQHYPQSYVLVDDGNLQGMDCSWVDDLHGESSDIPWLEADHQAAIVFTSGSTGTPVANVKSWGELVHGSRLLQQRLNISSETTIVATVPPQHMYGLETSVLAPLLQGGSVYAGKPFFPADVQQALSLQPLTKNLLVTTPLHLKACVNAGLDWPTVAQVISATAPLDKQFAAAVETELNTRVIEIFGCSEAGSFASRRTASQQPWQMYEGMRIEEYGEQAQISGGHLPKGIALSDEIDIIDAQVFRFLGRQSDMVKVAGKRISLAELSLRLLAIEGVEDAVFIPPRHAGQIGRLMALVVAPGVETQQIRHLLAKVVDPVFLPRPLIKVQSLPRNAANKLPQQALEALLTELGY